MTQIMWSPGVTLESIEKQVILKAFEFYKENKTATASALGVSVRTIDNKLSKFLKEKEEAEQRADEQQKRREHQLARSRGLIPPAGSVVIP